MFRAVVIAPPRTKKTSSRVVHMGQKCFQCHRGETARVFPSEAFGEWEKVAAPQLRDAFAAAFPAARPVVCARCHGDEKDPSYTGACIGCLGIGARPQPIDRPVHVQATIYRDAIRGDWCGYTQALGDALETAGVLVNDALIASWDGTRLAVDRARPRVEIQVLPFDEKMIDVQAVRPQLAMFPPPPRTP